MTTKNMHCPNCRFLYNCDAAYAGYRCPNCDRGLLPGLTPEAADDAEPIPLSVAASQFASASFSPPEPPPIVYDKPPLGYIRIDIDFHFKRDVSIAAVLLPLVLSFPAGWAGGWYLGISYSITFAAAAFGVVCCAVALRVVLKGEKL